MQTRVQALDPTQSEIMESTDVIMDVDFKTALENEKLPYEQLLGDALDGNPTRFATQPIIEGTWTALAPIVEHPGPAESYEPGTMGPPSADRLVEGLHPWIDPVSPPSERPA